MAKLNDNSLQPPKWIVPPGLREPLKRFEAKCNTVLRKRKRGRHTQLMIHGPTGVGKSMFAEYFAQYCSQASPTPIIQRLNCSAVPETLLESELFGYEKGAHNTAHKAKPGLFELTKGGILILEEIGEMPPTTQAKLLIAIENRQFYRLGGTKPIDLDALIVATTNVDKSQFREDFWHRFAHFEVPPLYQRRGDILYYVERFEPDLIKALNSGIALSLMAYNWPGNVREIESVCDIIRENYDVLNEQLAKDVQHPPAPNFDIASITDEYIAGLSRNSQLYRHIRRLESLGDRLGSEAAFSELTSKTKKQLFKKYDELSKHDTHKLKFHIDPNETLFTIEIAERLEYRLLNSCLTYGLIHKTLGRHLVNLDPNSEKLFRETTNKEVFRTRNSQALQNSQDISHCTNYMYDILFGGLKVFCKIFFQDLEANKNLLDTTNHTQHSEPQDEWQEHKKLNANFKLPPTDADYEASPKQFERNHRNIINFCEDFYRSPLSNFDNYPEWYKLAMTSSLMCLTGLEEIKDEHTLNLKALHSKHPENEFLTAYFGALPSMPSIKELPIESISLDELKALYYETLRAKIGAKRGAQKQIARIAGRTKGTISNYYKSDKRFNNPNFTPQKRIAIIARDEQQ